MTISEAKEIIRDRISIVDYIGQFVELKKSGSSYLGKCPFHDDKNPSFSVSDEKKLFRCFSGSCGKKGDIFTFVQEYEHVDFLEAVKMLAKIAGIEIDNKSSDFSKVELEKQQLYEIYKLVANEYFKILFSDKGKVGREYFKERNISFDTIKSFGLGYASDEYNRIYKFLKEKGYSDDILMKSELFTYKENGKVFDKFFNRVMFPILNEHNKVIAFGGRVLSKEKVPNKYINSKENLIFKKSYNLFALNKAKNSKFDYFILCEGNVDVIMLHQFGFDNAIASLGTGFNDYQAKLIKKHKKQVILSFDMDEAGIKFTLDAIPIFDKEGIKIRVLDLSPAKDPDEFLNKYGKEEFNNRLSKAKDQILFRVSIAKTKFDLNNPQQYRDYIIEVCKILSSIELKIIRNKYIDTLSSIENINKNDLIEALDNYIKNNTKELEKHNFIPLDNDESKKIIEIDKTESSLINTIFASNINIDKIKEVVSIDDFLDPYCKKIYELIINGFNQAQTFDSLRNDKDNEIYNKILFQDNNIDNALVNIPDDENHDAYYIDLLNQLIKKVKLHTIQNRINSIKDNEDFENYTKLNNELNNIRKIDIFINE